MLLGNYYRHIGVFEINSVCMSKLAFAMYICIYILVSFASPVVFIFSAHFSFQTAPLYKISIILVLYYITSIIILFVLLWFCLTFLFSQVFQQQKECVKLLQA